MPLEHDEPPHIRVNVATRVHDDIESLIVPENEIYGKLLKAFAGGHPSKDTPMRGECTPWYSLKKG
jgi:hypothetical protein